MLWEAEKSVTMEVALLVTETAHKSLIKPIAFKPVVAPQHYVSSPQQPAPPPPPKDSPPPPRPSPPQSYHTPPSTLKSSSSSSSANHSADDGYMSQDYHSHSTSNSSTEQPPGEPRVTYLTDSGHRMVVDRPDSFSSRGGGEPPSPSDSGVVEIETLLREKDAQIRQLRETMERNETAILQVCEEKQQSWEARLREVGEEWEARLRGQQQKAFKMEQALLMQLFKLQQDRKALKLEVEQNKGVKEELAATKAKLEETQWDMCQKVGHISHVKGQLKESKDDAAGKATELLGLKAKLKEMQQQMGEKDGEILKLEAELKESSEVAREARTEVEGLQEQVHALRDITPVSSGSEGEKLQQEINALQDSLAKCQVDFDSDREKWLSEKDKVIRYQRHLQLNYVQMANKNKVLEAEVQQLTLELENRDICLEGGKEGEESVC